MRQAVGRASPDAIVHMAALVPPLAYVNPELAREVNINGTRHLLDAAAALDRAPKTVYTSSYSVYGPRNPHRDLALLTGDTPVAPGDNYACHKIAGERLVRESGLPWTILRLSGVMPLGGNQMQQPSGMRYLFLLPQERRQHGIDARDAGLAIAKAVEAQTGGQVLMVAGGKEWQWIAGEFFATMFETIGFGSLPESAFRQADPEVDASWYYEDWVDATASEEMLQYQRHSPADYFQALKQQMGYRRALVRILAPVLRRQLVRLSPYYDQPTQCDARTHWEVACEAFGIDPALHVPG
ncbi:MAG: NAD-dependent epimerase/dehydratase family protein [Anaerolineae bacterium]|nr:NAD-dependent epimerase/dehydratase family protein [Anaerolineae bacterium]